MATGLTEHSTTCTGPTDSLPVPADGMGRRGARDSGSFWSARKRVQAALDSLVDDRAPGTPAIAATANLDTPDAHAPQFRPRTLRRDVAMLVLGVCTGLAIPFALVVLKSLV